MQNTTEILPSECPVRIASGTWRNRYGTTISLPDNEGLQWVELRPKQPGDRKLQKQFTRGQLADMRPLPVATFRSAA